ncbi:anti-sigma factor [Ramlibacter sp.]|uniref:anti-sigma factor n=1 Tax=Ramlibacter sp. TaxID=1917967 RepID=UPI002B850595|nr:anti-sigma factor [Ramlibacter sp.]HWI80680.1 anti-sigma factor [Ramlibacter sp.]
MDLMRHPELADRLAAAYGLGSLRGRARRRFEAQARQIPGLRALALAWQERFAAMTELQPGQQPSANVWRRIENALAHEREGRALQAQRRAPSRSWRGFAIAGAFATLAAVAVSVSLFTRLGERDDVVARLERDRQALSQQNVQLASQVQAAPDIRYVAMLSDDRSAPSVLVTFDPKHNTLTLKRLGNYDEGAEKSLQLWALPPGGAPRSLGVLPQGAVARLTAAENQVQVPALAISLEPKGGVPAGSGPTGPVLFKGAVVPTS